MPASRDGKNPRSKASAAKRKRAERAAATLAALDTTPSSLLGADDREGKAAFQRLDEGARDLVRGRWLQDDLDQERLTLAQRRRWKRSVAHAVVVLVGVQALQVFTLFVFLASFTGALTTGEILVELGAAAGAGLILGTLWWWFQLDSFAAALVAIPVSIVLQLLAGHHTMQLLLAPIQTALIARVVRMSSDGPGS